MPRPTLVRDVMTPLDDVVAFHPDDRVEDAARRLAERRLGGGPVVDADGNVVGLLSDDDLIVQETRLHAPTVITVLGAYITFPFEKEEFEDELRKAAGATVADVMDDEPVTCSEDDTLEDVATLLHERDLSRLPVVRDGKLVGIISRGDLIRAMLSPGE